MNYIFRNAINNDVLFLSQVIIEAEKSGSNTMGIANIMNIKISELQSIIINMLNEEIMGCEFSINSYVVAEYNNTPVAAMGGWIEKENEDNQSSSFLRANLIHYFLPEKNLHFLNRHKKILNGILIEREPHTLQLEYAYVKKEHRGKSLTKKIIERLTEIAKIQNHKIKKAQIQVFENNIPAIRTYESAGYRIVKRRESTHPDILKYFPWNVKLLMEKQI